jgi:cell fate regulator YaaT (PSP1 superfamily)
LTGCGGVTGKTMYKIADVEIDEGQALCCLRPESLAIHVGDACVVQCERVQEYGRVTRLAELDGNPPSERMLPEVLRCATLQDQAKAEDNALRSRMAVDTVAAGVEKHKLEMRLIRVRYSFDRALLRVTFSAEGRVDFRELIKDLAAELQTRIDMRQIGVRDEAGILGGVASCGRRLCCCTWLRNFEPVNVKMAKIQRLSLNPGAISGMCGRL